MLWSAVWTLLVVGTLVGAFWLGRDLWRTGAALLAELGRASESLERLAGTTTDGVAQAVPIRAQVFDDRAVLHGRVSLLRREHQKRAARRADRHVATFARWRAYSR